MLQICEKPDMQITHKCKILRMKSQPDAQKHTNADRQTDRQTDRHTHRNLLLQLNTVQDNNGRQTSFTSQSSLRFIARLKFIDSDTTLIDKQSSAAL